MSTRWASGRPGSRVLREPETTPEPTAAPRAAVPEADADHSQRIGLAEQAAAISAEWAPTAGRILLGVVFFWFGYHELIQPGHWTQYVPVVSESSSLAVVLVLTHGWVLFVTAAALVAGIAPRAAAAIASVLLLEIVISLVVTGVSDTALRDLGVLGLAVCLTGCKNQRLVLRG